MRYFLKLSYNGENYCGWQVQPEQKSVQGEIERVITTLLGCKTRITGAGRTDSGVHALEMFAHFDVSKPLPYDFKDRLNAFIPEDIYIADLFLVDDDAHARFDAVSRSYEYRIWLGRNPFLSGVTWQIHSRELDVFLMNKAARMLLEHKNFQCFSKVKTDVKTFDCDITNANWEQDENQLTFYITANRFLRNMVRAIVGTLVSVGLGKISPVDFRRIIQSKDRSKAGVSAPSKGLFLTQVKYNFVKSTTDKN